MYVRERALIGEETREEAKYSSDCDREIILMIK